MFAYSAKNQIRKIENLDKVVNLIRLDLNEK